MTRWIVGLVALAALAGGVARAEEEAPDPAAALFERLEELRKAESWTELQTAVAEVPEVYKACEDRGLRGKLMGALGKVLKEKDAGEARVAAVDALVACEDPKEAWKELSRAMPDPRVEEAEPFDLAVVRASGLLAESKAIKDLYELVEKAKDNDLAREAVVALGGFHGDKRNRVSILEELMGLALKTRPGVSTSKNVSPEARERWGLLGPAFLEAMNTLTGQKVVTFEDWETLYKDNKRNLKALFIDS